MPALDNTANRYLAKYYFEGITIPEQETAQNPMNLIASIWLCGVAVLLVYAAVSYVHIRRKVRESVRIEGNIYICDRIQTPFIFGVLNPRIYLPSSLKEVQIKMLMAHEKAHIRRLDYLWNHLVMCCLQYIGSIRSAGWRTFCFAGTLRWHAMSV